MPRARCLISASKLGIKVFIVYFVNRCVMIVLHNVCYMLCGLYA